ncbi:MAG: YcxB family protein [Cyclobacteriaceae bacterium]|nr:YcxB family protein [Cyclobacteriaceae bacterium]
MLVKTKKYKLETGKYIKIALPAVLRQQWWVALIAVAIMAGSLIIWSHWWITGALIAYTLYVLFWLIQFAGITQLEQGKVLFERLSYEITSQQILIKLNTKQGMPIKWEQIKRADKKKDGFVLWMSKVQLIYLPFKIFNSENERKFTETILKRKDYIK